MTDQIDAEELATRVGTNEERISELVGLGIIQPENGTFHRRDVMRVRVVEQLERAGIEVETLAAGLESGHLTLGYLESAGRRHPTVDQTFAEMAGELGVAFSSLEDLYVAFGLLRPADDEPVPEDDYKALKFLGVLIAAGLQEKDVLRMARVWGESTRRVAEYQTHAFHTLIEERFRARGLNDNEAYEAALREVGVRIGRSGEDLQGWLFRRHLDILGVEHQFEHVETALERAGVRRRPPRQVGAVVFADLTGFTELTEESGDDVAAEVAVTFSQVASAVAARNGGHVVKMLGDGVFLQFDDPDDAVLASLEIVETTPARGLPETHIGVNAGPVFYDEGDYFGRTVNMAARIASQAGSSEVFVGEPVVAIVTGHGFRLSEVGEFELKGIADPVLLFRATRVG